MNWSLDEVEALLSRSDPDNGAHFLFVQPGLQRLTP